MGLSLGDEVALVACVKADGVEKSGLASCADALIAKCASKNETEAIASLKLVQALAEGAPEAEVFTKDCLSAALQQGSLKLPTVRKQATQTALAICKNMSPFAMKSMLPAIFASLPAEKKWQSRELALNCISVFKETAPKQLGDMLPLVVPELTACMWDTKKQVKKASTDAMRAALEVVGNKDIEFMTERILVAITKPKEVPEIMHEMASVTFVQSVESPALAMVVPLLLRGLRERSTATKRQSAVIINNMSKLVDYPLDAAPFLPLLLPALEQNANSIADPEARDVTQRAVEQLKRLKVQADKAISVRGDVSKLKVIFEENLPACSQTYVDKVIKHACVIATTMMDLEYMEDAQWKKNLFPLFTLLLDDSEAEKVIEKVRVECEKMLIVEEDEEDDDDAEELCNCQFTLAYGTKTLLHNTKMRLRRGKRYGLLGCNDSGKTTLMRSIANNQVEGFPDVTEVRTVFVEADIQGEQSHLSCVDYVMADEEIQALDISKDEVERVLNTVGFTSDGKAKPNHAVSTLSGGWRMKLALARAMLQKADILLLDEPTNHLDVINVAWVKTYLNSITDVTAIIVSHDVGLLNDCCTEIIQIENLKLNQFRGNLDEFVKTHPAARAYFSFTESKLKFKFPQPGPIEGVKSKGKALMKMNKCTFTYPVNETPTLFDISIQVSLSSRVACVGENGAGKSTMIKLLVGEIEPQEGDVWKHPNARIAYVAQHAFHHIENHLNKTPNEYIRWRYANNGEDKESLVKVTMQFTPEEEKRQRTPFEIQFTDPESGKVTKVKKVVSELVGGRKTNKSKDYEYEVKYAGSTSDSGDYLPGKTLKKMGWDKAMKAVDLKIAQRAGLYVRPLSTKNVEKHLADCGLAAEFGTHYRMSALSGGQKVKVVLAAAMWNQPHILILDEPTNYLDREALGALAGAIEEFEGGICLITHNQEFADATTRETWVVANNTCDIKGDADWTAYAAEAIELDLSYKEDRVDALGNKIEVKKTPASVKPKEKKKMMKELKKRLKADPECRLTEFEEECCNEWGIFEDLA